jgi:hypothetical protein
MAWVDCGKCLESDMAACPSVLAATCLKIVMRVSPTGSHDLERLSVRP